MANINPQPQSGAVNNMQDTSANLTDQAKQKSSEVMQQAQDTAKSTLEQQKGRAAGSVDAVAQALRQTGRSLHDQDQASFGRFAEQAADRLEQFSNDLQTKSVDEMIDDVQDLARREPALFLGGAMLAGLLAARFFKASGDRTRSRQMGSMQYGRYGQYGRSGGYGRPRGYTQQDLTDYRRQTLSDEYTGTYDRGNYGTPDVEGTTGSDFSTTTGYDTGSTTPREYPGASTLGGEQNDEPGSTGSSTWRTEQ